MTTPDRQPASPVVSVVIIVQDDEARIGEAIDSARSQGLDDIEILVVDHGSQDGTRSVVEERAAQDSRVRLIALGHRRGRPGTPINAGIAAARAPWVTVVGSDDVLLPGGLARMLDRAEEHDAQMVVGGIEAYDMETDTSRQWAAAVITQEMVLDGIDQYPELVADTTGAGKLYNTAFIREHALEFPPDIFFQDQVFTLRYYATARRIAVTPGYVYRWRSWPTAKRKSVTKSRHTLDNLRDRVTANTLIDDYLNEHPHPEVQRAVREKFLRHDLMLYAIGLGQGRDDEYRSEFMRLMGDYLPRIPDDVVQQAPFSPRLCVAAIRAGRLDAVMDLAEHRATEAFWAVERRDIDGRRFAVLPSWRADGDDAEPPVMVDITDLREDLIPDGALRTLARLEHVEQVGKQEIRLGFALLCGPRDPILDEPVLRAVNSLSGEWVDFAGRRVDDGDEQIVAVEVPAASLPVVRTVRQSIRLELGSYAGDGDWVQVSAIAPKNPADATVTIPGLLGYGSRFRVRAGGDAIQLTQIDPQGFNRRGIWRLNRERKRRLTDASTAPLPVREASEAYAAAAGPLDGISGSRFDPSQVSAVLFESFFGEQVADAPLQLSRALHRVRPDVVQFWSFEPGGACPFVPAWAVPVPRGTQRYVEALAQAQVWVDNGWIKPAFIPGAHRYFVQTFHGVPIKVLGVDVTAGLDAERAARFVDSVLENSSRWSGAPTSGEYYTRTFGHAFAMENRLLATGGPRTDPLLGDAAARRRADLRERWGVGERTVVLHAPTVRREPISPSYRPPSVRLLAELLGPDFFWLSRSHYRDLGTLVDDRLHWFSADVSKHPSITDLMLIADVLVSDYSSVLFDFAQTGRPSVGFATDVDFYENEYPRVYEHVAAILGHRPFTDEEGLAAAIRSAASEGLPSAQAARIVADYAPLDAELSADRVWRELGIAD